MSDRRGFDLIRKHAIARYRPGGIHGEGEVIAYCDAPQVCIRRPDGSVFWWWADMCEFSDPAPAVNETAALYDRAGSAR